MQLVSMGVYGRGGQRRDVTFKPNALNILTGKSKTGKSAILDVVEFCLGRNTVTIPSGVISDHSSWYYTLVSFGEQRVFIARPNPETASTGHAMVRTGGRELEPLDFAELEINADTTVIRDTLTTRLGIERYLIEPEPGSLRAPFEVSARQALFFCFQAQGEIANRDVLFHRATDNAIKTTIRDTLPYFLGAATPDQYAIRRQLTNARRILQRLQNDIRAIERDLDDQAPRTMRLVSTGASLGVPQHEDVDANLTSVRAQLEAILQFEPPEIELTLDMSRAYGEHTRSVDVLTERSRQIDARMETLRSLRHAQHRAAEEAAYQQDRLSAVDLMIPSDLPDGQLGTCPLCNQRLQIPDESIEAIRSQLSDLRRNLSQATEADRQRDVAIEALAEDRRVLQSEIRRELVELDSIKAQTQSIAEGASLRERIAQLKGRVLQEIERGLDTHEEIATLRERERVTRGQVARLEELEDADSPTTAFNAALDTISGSLTAHARQLELEGSEHQIVLDPVELSIAAIYPGGRRPLSRMGSAENWVGYHLVTHLALHEWFVAHDRPVPRFLMLDQPTQA
ncbi:MAG: DUF3732 domain-containing protein, partial [Lacisediminihabitans sp.]